MTENTLKFRPRIAFDNPVVIAIDANLDKANRKSACKNIMKMHQKTIKQLKARLVELKKPPADFVIVIANINDDNGGEIAEMLMPGRDWSKDHKKNKAIFAVGLALRKSIHEMIGFFDEDAARKLQIAFSTKVVVIDHGVVDVY